MGFIWTLFCAALEFIGRLAPSRSRLRPDRTTGLECVMQRNTFDRSETVWNWPAEALRAAEFDGADEVDRWPTAGELFFEAGIVLAVALGAGVIVELVMGGA